ncbi:unnamed protein product [Lota lota]
MKPPPRQRILPNRYEGGKHERKRRRQNVCTWSRVEQRGLLTALERLNRRRGRVEIDYAELQKRLPKRSIPQLRSMVQELQARALSKGAHQLLRQRRAEVEGAEEKPVQLWRDMASFVAGDLEEPISTAFSQMLVVSSTEPRTLSNSAGAPPPSGPAQPTKTAAVTPGGHTKETNRTVFGPILASERQPVEGTRDAGHQEQMSKWSVDYQKIYLHLAHARKESCSLSPMECAVVLDLLMALPEELPLLDCSKLRQHMIEAYASLSAPARSSDPATERCEDPTPPAEANCPGATKAEANCPGATKAEANCPGATKAEANCPGATKAEANCPGATKAEANCPGATKAEANCPGATKAEANRNAVNSAGAGEDGVLDDRGAAAAAAAPPSERTLCPLNPFMVPLKLLVKRT